MKAAYVVTESEAAASLFKRLLPAELLKDTGVVSAGAKYAAFSLASTILSERSRPVILVVDADSDDLAVVHEQKKTLEGLLLPAAATAVYKVCVAVPSVAALAQEFEDPLNPEQLHRLQQYPLVHQVTQFLAHAFSQAA